MPLTHPCVQLCTVDGAKRTGVGAKIVKVWISVDCLRSGLGKINTTHPVIPHPNQPLS